ncbi:TetR/AcrR family transcriptional regulator [Timonella sp. A28]|uniref:TetR/AcrR family transcriptional regulator n=1 Tax=Timonella sp. A28 TaxID=3442640 RepID=UPI003EB75F6C
MAVEQGKQSKAEGGSKRNEGGPRKKYARGLAAREEILEAAARLFGNVGFHETSLRDIAAQVGMSHPGLLHHFPNKNALLMAVLEHRDQQDLKWMNETATAEAWFSGEAFVLLLQRNMERPGAACLFTRMAMEATNPHHPAHEYFVLRNRWLLKKYREILAEGVERGIIRDDIDVQSSSRALSALLEGLHVQWLLESSTQTSTQSADIAAALEGFFSLLRVPKQ